MEIIIKDICRDFSTRPLHVKKVALFVVREKERPFLPTFFLLFAFCVTRRLRGCSGTHESFIALLQVPTRAVNICEYK